MLVERICGICSHTHPLCYCQAVEEAMGVEPPDRARYIRTIIAELERIHSHLLWAGVALHLIGYDSLFMYFWRYREPICMLFELLTGNRQNYAINCVGGVRRDIDVPKRRDRIMRTLKEVGDGVRRLEEMLLEDPLVKARLVGVGVLTKDDARRYCVVGPTARGSGVPIDVRVCEPYAAYAEVGVDIKVFSEGDVMAKTLVRVQEVLESIEIVERAIDAMPGGPLRAELPEPPVSEGIGKTEAPRGEDIHYVRLNGTVVPERHKVRAPTYANIPSLVPQLLGETIADAPIIIGSIDPCLSCTDRLSVVDAETGKPLGITYEKLVHMSRKKSRRVLRGA